MAKNKLPKKIAGFRVPKSIRKSKMLRALLKSPMGRDILANAITAGAGAAAAVLVAERDEIKKAGRRGLKKSTGALGVAGEAIQSAASAAIGVVAEAAQTVLPEKTPKGKGAVKH